MNEDLWNKQLKELNRYDDSMKSEIEQALFPESFLISDTITNIVDLIVKDFVLSWYSNISQDQSFIIQLKHQLRISIVELKERLEMVDFSDLIVFKLIPTITEHFNNFLVAEEVVKNKKTILSRKLTNSMDIETAIASAYKRLHPAIKVKDLNLEKDRKIYLQESAKKFLPYLIGEPEINSQPVAILIKHIFASCVLFPVISMLGEPDFWNQMIVNTIGEVLKDRYQVKQFRSVLDLHANDATINTIKLREMSKSLANTNGESIKEDDYSNNKLMKTLLVPETDHIQFDEILKKIDNSSSFFELKQLRNYTSFQISQGSEKYTNNIDISQERIEIYNKRLQILKTSIDNRLSILSETNAKIVPLKKKDSKIISSSNLSLISNKNEKMNLTLMDILNNPTSLSYFMDFMDQRSRSVLLQFWMAVNGIKNPLEDLNDYGDNNENGDLSVADENDFNEENDDEYSEADTSFGDDQSAEIKQIFDEFFSNRLLKISPYNYSIVARFVNLEPKSKTLYQKAKRSILIVQRETYNRMDKTDLIAFKKSNLFPKIISGEGSPLKNNNNSSSKIANSEKSGVSTLLADEKSNQLINYDLKWENSESSNANHEKISDDVLKAVEDALNEIMAKHDKNGKNAFEASVPPSRSSSVDDFQDSNANNNITTRNPRLIDPELQKNLFGLDSVPGIFAGDDDLDEKNNSSITNLKKSSKLFDDISDSEEDGDNISNYEEMFSNYSDLEKSELHLAAPGDLNLSEEINTLTTEIESLENQVSIIDPLLRKAEITNNVAELKILRKSKVSLEREIEIKELQKQQYIVQENENSLYGKSRVRIQSYINENDFTLYIIEVQKLASDDSNVVTAGWIVARRFSQFYKLNEYLKSKYDPVRELKFPKRRVVLKFQQSTLIEERKNQLEVYLQNLIKMPDVCSNKLFRSFLSSEVFNLEFSDSLNSSTKNGKRSNLETVATKLYNGISNTFPFANPSSISSNRLSSKKSSDSTNKNSSDRAQSDRAQSDSPVTDMDEYELQVNEMQNELNAFDDQGEISFVKPICDFIISIFSLNKSNSWLRGRAVLVILQRILGSTIEKKTRENILFAIKSEEKILDNLNFLKDALWPNGIFRESSKARSNVEKSFTKNESKMILERFLIDSTSKIFGLSNSKFAAIKVHEMFQNEILLNHLVYTLYDEILIEIFPEISDK
ncbi:hypothetical protein PACTADRAFT_74444 [Pachysolen tannophilus NRRL Y-2460]|uniref:PXA domain-containing protein n=1 Tax=Pachysolen tannophilus NRRL Y-2460 TaxID=669874 RepID=A0A1E4TYM5_PACTA|nr:hypothetical protein PACTADRAFT_74444 [Pachysolen tannophilus NRRL Y-2460]